jgi:hypothetical protein
MPVKTFRDKEYEVRKDLPTHLDHKPVYAIPYVPFDGMFANNTDCQYLSVGLAQWDSNDVSLKTMRFRDKWSRQAEEIPIHRVIDSSIFLSKVLFDSENNRFEMERNLFENQKFGMEVKMETNRDEDLEKYNEFMEEHMDLFKRRFNALYNTLDRLKKEGKF